MKSGFIVHQKTYSHEIVGVFDSDEVCQHLFIQRSNQLNLNEVVKANISSYHKGLKGYFVETEKGLSAFVPSNEKKSIGESVFIKIKKEARFLKDATAEFVDDEPFLPNLLKQVTDIYPFEIRKDFYDFSFCIEELLEKSVGFADGAEFLIERTNALWTIDVDSAKSQLSLSEINKKAVPLIVKEIQRKNLSGMIVVDFAGYKTTKDKEFLLNELKHCFKGDSRTKIYGFSKLNLLEIKRARTSASLMDLFYQSNGLKMPAYVNYLIEMALFKSRTARLTLEVHPNQYLFLPEEIKKQVSIIQNLNIQPDYFELKEG